MMVKASSKSILEEMKLRFNHLKKIAQKYNEISSSLGSFYMYQLLQYNTFGIELNDTERKICPYCGAFRKPGNYAVRIKPKLSKKKILHYSKRKLENSFLGNFSPQKKKHILIKKRKNYIITKCFLCKKYSHTLFEKQKQEAAENQENTESTKKKKRRFKDSSAGLFIPESLRPPAQKSSAKLKKNTLSKNASNKKDKPLSVSTLQKIFKEEKKKNLTKRNELLSFLQSVQHET